MIHPGDWAGHILMITFSLNRDQYSYISYYCPQERLMEELPSRFGAGQLPGIVNVCEISEESFAVLEETYRNNNRIFEEN